ncbi:MAG: hypothetical protein HY765_08445 [Rhodomicrobium sp.]|nr:hypothetical protein [Rhodomicrobium sp.]
MKKLIVASAAILAATLFSGNASALPGNLAAGVQTSNEAVNVRYGCYHRRYRCCGCRVVYYNPCGGCGWGFPFWGGGCW